MSDDKSASTRQPPDPDQISAFEPPGNRIPAEILTKTLKFRELERDLLFATHVCRRWRSALIPDPFLWTSILCHNVDYTSTYLKRSKSAPIDVEAVKTRSVSPNDSALELVIPHLGRVRSMRIIPSPGETLPAIFKFRSPAPLLQELIIAEFPQNYLSRLPRDFLGHHVPSLRSLSWSDTPMVPAPFSFSSFIRLPYASGPPIPLRTPLGLISSAPLLESALLWINDADPFPGVSPVHDIHLNSLHHLDLVSGTALSRVLPHFKAPRLKEFTLLLTFDVGVLTIADLLPSNSYPLLTKVTSMDFCTGHKGSELNLRGEGTKVTVSTDPCMGPTDNFFSTTSFSFTQITKLVLYVIAKPIAAKIGEFTNLERLELLECEEEAQVLSDLSPLPGPGSSVPCPHLMAAKVVFNDPTTHAVDCLKQMVRSRKEAGNPLATVKLASFDGMDEILDIDERNEWIGQPPVLE